jgi:UDP-2-acetamido-2,6-beta-L-arabino-hexul-4-ose reductase
MNILITGAQGFIAKNLIATLENIRDGKDRSRALDSDISLLLFNRHSSKKQLVEYCGKADFVFHLAGVNRPPKESEFLTGNVGFTTDLLAALREQNNFCPVLLTSSTQAALDNPYGKSKRAAEAAVFQHAVETGATAFVYRLPGVFGKWCRPNYNSVIATFCHNITRELPITVTDPSIELNLVYIDDVIDEFLAALGGNARQDGDYHVVNPVHSASLGRIAELLSGFKAERADLSVPELSDSLVKKLYSTYLSYLPTDNLSYSLKTNVDQRGSFTEIIRTQDRGQFSINVSKPGVTKGNHWHHTKCERFLVIKGTGAIRFRSLHGNEITEYHVSDQKLEMIDIPPGYTHSLENLGDEDMITLIWANESFDPLRPDTYYLEVEK